MYDRELDLIIPSMGGSQALISLSTLYLLPFRYKLHLILNRSWVDAINEGILRRTHSNNVLIMDDDVFLHPTTFKDFDKYYPLADVFGFKLLYPNGQVQHAGGAYVNDNGKSNIGHIKPGENQDAVNQPYYCCHCTAALLYIKGYVIDAIGGASPDFAEGLNYEDVDLSFRIIKAGFQILYIPNTATHMHGISKSTFFSKDDLRSRTEKSFNLLKERYFTDQEFITKIAQYPKPVIDWKEEINNKCNAIT